MDFDDTARARISTALRARRAQLGLSQEEVARASGGLLSTASLRVMEGAGRASFRAKSLTGVARALGWPSDAVARIAEGADPESFATSSVSAPVAPMVAGVELVTVEHLDSLRDDLARQHTLIVELTERVRRLESSVGDSSSGEEVVASAASSGDRADAQPAGRRRTARQRVTSFDPEVD